MDEATRDMTFDTGAKGSIFLMQASGPCSHPAGPVAPAARRRAEGPMREPPSTERMTISAGNPLSSRLALLPPRCGHGRDQEPDPACARDAQTERAAAPSARRAGAAVLLPGRTRTLPPCSATLTDRFPGRCGDRLPSMRWNRALVWLNRGQLGQLEPVAGSTRSASWAGLPCGPLISARPRRTATCAGGGGEGASFSSSVGLAARPPAFLRWLPGSERPGTAPVRDLSGPQRDGCVRHTTPADAPCLGAACRHACEGNLN